MRRASFFLPQPCLRLFDVLVTSDRGGPPKTMCVVVASMVGWAELAQSWEGGRKDGTRALTNGPAINGA